MELALPISEISQAGESRRAAVRLAEQLGFNETQRGRVAIVVTELARNLVQHAQGGELLLRGLEREGSPGIEVLVLDKGRGIVDIAHSLTDGVSTCGTPGTGLGAVRRIADVFDLYSRPGHGTAVLAQIYTRRHAQRDGLPHLVVGAVSVPLHGETVCGDAWAVRRSGLRDEILVADGLGHGEHAHTAASEAIRIFNEREGRSPAELLDDVHRALRATRGAAVAIASLDYERREIQYAGLGNICGVVLTGNASHSMVSHSGTAGLENRRIHQFAYKWPQGATVVINSDGLATWRFDADTYPGLLARHPSLLAGVLYRDFKRGRDDATVVAVRELVP